MEPDGFWIISTMSMMQLAVFNTPSSQAVTNWIKDRVVQDYWVPNSEIIVSKKKLVQFPVNCLYTTVIHDEV